MNVEFEYNLDVNGRELPVQVVADGRVWREKYGCDADGNRGEWQTACEVDEIKIYDAFGRDLTKKVEDKYEKEFFRIQDKAKEELYECYESD